MDGIFTDQYLYYFYDYLFLCPLFIADHWFKKGEQKYAATVSYGKKSVRSEISDLYAGAYKAVHANTYVFYYTLDGRTICQL